MRTQFLHINDYATLEQAEDECLWAACVYECDSGFMAFESVDDAEIWNNQK